MVKTQKKFNILVLTFEFHDLENPKLYCHHSCLRCECCTVSFTEIKTRLEKPYRSQDFILKYQKGLYNFKIVYNFIQITFRFGRGGHLKGRYVKFDSSKAVAQIYSPEEPPTLWLKMTFSSRNQLRDYGSTQFSYLER